MKVTRSNDLAWENRIDHGRFGGRRKALGGEKLTCGLWELPPGKRSFPMHLHHATEEALWVVSGRAKVRTPDGETEIGPGDFVSFPPGGPAHQLVNDGHEPMIYVAMSSTIGIDVVEYPESGKVAAAVGQPWAGGKRMLFRKANPPDYWEGEE
jgi:uncharacterized cupin superfamily protein